MNPQDKAKINNMVEEAANKSFQDMTIKFDYIYDEETQKYRTEEITFKNIVGHQVGSNWVAVIIDENTTKLFKTEDIKEITVNAYKE